MSRHLLTVVALGCLVLALSACGWHVRGAVELPPQMKVTYLDLPDPHGDFARQLRLALDSSGVRLTDNKDEATGVLHVISARSSNRPLSVSGKGLPQENKISFTVQFELLAGEKTLLAPQTVTLDRDYTFDPREYLGKTKQADILLADMQRRIVDVMMRRLEAVTRSEAHAPDKPTQPAQP